MGKGDKPRPVDKAKFDRNYDRIFGKQGVTVPNEYDTEEAARVLESNDPDINPNEFDTKPEEAQG